MVYEFCTGREAKYPLTFLKGWMDTLGCDDHQAYDALFRKGVRVEADCLAHARRKFDELAQAKLGDRDGER